jgi:hypothetical protein
VVRTYRTSCRIPEIKTILKSEEDGNMTEYVPRDDRIILTLGELSVGKFSRTTMKAVERRDPDLRKRKCYSRQRHIAA